MASDWLAAKVQRNMLLSANQKNLVNKSEAML